MSALRMLVREECPETDVYLGAVLAHGHLLTGAYERCYLTSSQLVSSHHEAACVKPEWGMRTLSTRINSDRVSVAAHKPISRSQWRWRTTG